MTAGNDLVSTIRRELERTAVRARNGIRYAGGESWIPESPTPKAVVWRQGKAELWRYHSNHTYRGPPVLLFIGLVSRSYILDMHADNSLVARLLAAGFDVYVLDWGVADEADSHNTLETYTGRYLPRALAAVLRESGDTSASIIGYCMGGNLALLALAARRLPVRNLITMATAVDFSKLAGLAGAVCDLDLHPEALIDWTGNVPASYLRAFFRVRNPTADILPYANLWENLWRDDYVGSHQAMARWARTHVPFPGASFRQVLESWVRDNGFMTGKMRLAGSAVDLRQVTCPMLSVLATRDDLIPPDAVRPLAGLVGSEDFTTLEIDAGHAGLTVGRQAGQVTVPKLIEWLRHRQHEEL
jgi:polyhydroxyalkanoate synthase